VARFRRPQGDCGVPCHLISPLTPINFFNEADLPAKHVYDFRDYTILFQQGEEKGFAWFFRSLYPALSFYAFKITGDREASEEIASSAFIKIWESHEQFSDPLSIRKYLYCIVRNDALKHLRKEKQSVAFNREVIYLYANEHEKDCFNNLVTTEITLELHQAIDALPAECKKVFRLMYIEGKSIQETAEALHLSASTVKTQKKRGLDALRKKIVFVWAFFC
jgi:RNA polymerase sigma-70 factor (ECF subfamily)